MGKIRFSEAALIDVTKLTDAELVALGKTVHEARFPDVFNDPAIWLSPFVINLHVAVVEEDRRRLLERGDKRGLDSLTRWLQWRGRPEREVFRSRLAGDERFRLFIIESGVDYVRSALRPFLVDDNSAAELVELAIELHGGNESSRAAE